MSSNGHGPAPTPSPRHRDGAPWWALVVGLCGVIAILSVLDSAPGWVAILLLAGSLAVLGLAGWRRGVDSRDGADWRPHKAGGVR